MPLLLLATKLGLPSPRPGGVVRPRLIARLDQSLAEGRHLTLVSAPAGFGKTTLLRDWAAGCERLVAWLSLDAGDGDPQRFLTYVAAALQQVAPGLGAGTRPRAPRLLRASSAPPAESTLTALLNDLAALSTGVVLVLDDYHVLDAPAIHAAVGFLVEHLPAQAHLVIATREDPPLPLARWRARGHLAELRVPDLRFTPDEAATFLAESMGLRLSADEVAELEARTEGWIAGLQLAALSLQDQDDVAGFIASFTGRHHFVLDYLVEEVLQRQSPTVETFLLRTSILERLCGPLCDAVLADPAVSGRTCWPSSNAPTCSSSRSTGSGAGTATTTSPPSCCANGWPRARIARRSPRSSAGPARGTRTTASRWTPSTTPRPPTTFHEQSG